MYLPFEVLATPPYFRRLWKASCKKLIEQWCTWMAFLLQARQRGAFTSTCKGIGLYGAGRALTEQDQVFIYHPLWCVPSNDTEWMQKCCTPTHRHWKEIWRLIWVSTCTYCGRLLPNMATTPSPLYMPWYVLAGDAMKGRREPSKHQSCCCFVTCTLIRAIGSCWPLMH